MLGKALLDISRKVVFSGIVAFSLSILYQTFRSPKEHCVCGVRIPEGGGMCDCGEYNGRMTIINIDRQKAFEEELKRIKEDRKIRTKLLCEIENMVIKIYGKEEIRERELNRIEEEKRKGNDCDSTFL